VIFLHLPFILNLLVLSLFVPYSSIYSSIFLANINHAPSCPVLFCDPLYVMVILTYLFSTSLPSQSSQCPDVSCVAYRPLSYFLHLSRLQHSAYVPSCHRGNNVPYPLLGPFPICSIDPKLVVNFLNKIAF
jgi:hypothetical protein